MHETDTKWLVLRAQAGDREALEALLERAQQPLYRYLAHVLADAALAEDVLQDVLFRIYRKLIWLREPALFPAWAFRIASRAAFRKLKKMKRLKEEPLVDDVVQIENIQPLVDALPAHLEALSPASRGVVALHYLEGLSLQEVADVLAIPLGTAKSRLAYGLRRLREALES
ncbi:MAG TPA: RNA polymerase sigma factor [Vicinamibacterales bacterium]|nr:RNA polymerase sigma factor [Vicinamibacterales bacterium]